MECKGFLSGVAGAALFVGSLGIGPSAAMPPKTTLAQGEAGSQLMHKVQSGRCAEDSMFAAGSQRLSPRAARQSAARAWQNKVRSKLGENFMDLENARHKRYECAQTAKGLVLGLHRCQISALPCRQRPR
jgi:hypothetical protein